MRVDRFNPTGSDVREVLCGPAAQSVTSFCWYRVSEFVTVSLCLLFILFYFFYFT